MSNKILVYIQHNNEKIDPVSIELIGEAQRMSAEKDYEIYGVSFGSEEIGFLDELKKYSIKKVLHITNEKCYTNIESVVNGIVRVIKDIQPDIVLIGATKEGRAIAPCVAVKMKTGLTADCIELQLSGNGELLQIRPAFDDKVLAHIVTHTRPQMATVRPGVMNPPEAGKFDVEIVKKELPEELINHKCEVCEVIPEQHSSNVDIRKEKKLVVMGAGIKNLEDVTAIENWAKSIGAEFGCSRKLVERGWFTVERQVGLSGNSVHAECMITLGVSGSIQFQAGIKNVKKIIAVNNDAEAPILKIADFPVQMDVEDFLEKIR